MNNCPFEHYWFNSSRLALKLTPWTKQGGRFSGTQY